MKKKYSFTILLMLFSIVVLGQTNDNLFSRLQAISNHGIDFFNVDGIEITSQEVEAEFTQKNIAKKFKGLKIKAKEIIESDTVLKYKNYYVFKSIENPQGFYNNLSYYFIANGENKILNVTFAYMNKSDDKNFERMFIQLVKEKSIPDNLYHSQEMGSVNFAGREIKLGGSCYWMGVNNIQCPYYGQMNWSVHKDLEDAKQTANNYFIRLKGDNKGKITSDTTENVIFEGTETIAHKIVFDFTGILSFALRLAGGKTLIIYYVACPVRGNFISCIMSFWNSDNINPSGLPPLLEEVMQIKSQTY
jgi:hypothetical protein